jgi:hypothetical protein
MDRLAPSAEDLLDRADVRGAVSGLLADRSSAEARALYLTLAKYIDRRVSRVSRARYADLLPRARQEELVGEVLLELMRGSLVGFRGQSLPELLGYVRRICDRVCWRAARHVVRGWNAAAPDPEAAARMSPDSPFDDTDQAYLLALLEAGSRSEHARREGVSRAAVTQRLQRIRRRISQMSRLDRAAAEAWMRERADEAARRRPRDG